MDGNKEFSYEIQYTKAAEKFMKSNEDIREAYESAIDELMTGEHPEQIDVKRIVGRRGNYYRIRIGNYRVVYAVINGIIVVVKTLLAGPRGDVYKKMKGI